MKPAVRKMASDAPMRAEHGNASLLCLLDLWAAFDTVDYDILI